MTNILNKARRPFTQVSSELHATLGPLRYKLVAHDAHGRIALMALRDAAACESRDQCSDRLIHALAFIPNEGDAADMRTGRLPARLRDAVGLDLPRSGWSHQDDDCGWVSWLNSQTNQSLWTAFTASNHFACNLQLPWLCVSHDIVEHGGAIIHAAIAAKNDVAVAFMAPSGGGKSTVLSHLPDSWLRLADDAALVWRDATGTPYASPLPTRSVLIGSKHAVSGTTPWRLSLSAPLKALFFLEKGPSPALEPISKAQLFLRLYAALLVFIPRDKGAIIKKRRMFTLAEKLSQTIPSWILRVDKQGDYWHLVEGELTKFSKNT